MKAGLSGMNTVKAGRVGKIFIKVRNHELPEEWRRFEVTDAKVKVTGIMTGDRIFSVLGGLSVLDLD